MKCSLGFSRYQEIPNAILLLSDCFVAPVHCFVLLHCFVRQLPWVLHKHIIYICNGSFYADSNLGHLQLFQFLILPFIVWCHILSFYVVCLLTNCNIYLVFRLHSGKDPACQCKFNPWVGKIPWRRKWQPTPIFLPGKSYWERSLVGYSPWCYKESDMIELHARVRTHTHTHTLFLLFFSFNLYTIVRWLIHHSGTELEVSKSHFIFSFISLLYTFIYFHVTN